jgi:acyloxyacyl hydrolase
VRYQLLIALLALFGVVALAQATQEQAVLRDKLEADISMVKYFTYRPLNNNCMACTLIATMIEGIARGQSGPIDHFIANKLCPLFPGSYQFICEYFIENYGPIIISMLEKKANPDDICKVFGFCTNPRCLLFGPSNFVASAEMKQFESHSDSEKLTSELKRMLLKAEMMPTKKKHETERGGFDVPLPPSHKVLPYFDNDGDYFSTYPTLRGYNWRGQDCNDSDANIYPGRKAVNQKDSSADYNCNGIYGRDEVSGKTWKELYCGGSGQLGVAVMGGSACSHFAIRGKWVAFNNITSGTYSDMLEGAENELDWPQKSWGTGYETWSGEGAINSIYLTMRERNLCNHRDYQQLGVNGYSSKEVFETVSSLGRRASLDHPMTVFHSPLGDDVCNMHVENTVAYMTTPEEFRTYVYGTLKQLDSILPPGSHVMFVGLVNGSILWDTLHNRIHPFGIPYPQLYSWLLCLRSNPCVGWLNPDAATRAQASARAKLLSDQYPLIIQQHAHEFKNFDLAYYPFPLKPIFDEWTAAGKDPALLIEPVDGFHPSTIANSLAAKWLSDHMARDHPSFLGPINPHNAAIKARFGSQGGY